MRLWDGAVPINESSDWSRTRQQSEPILRKSHPQNFHADENKQRLLDTNLHLSDIRNKPAEG